MGAQVLAWHRDHGRSPVGAASSAVLAVVAVVVAGGAAFAWMTEPNVELLPVAQGLVTVVALAAVARAVRAEERLPLWLAVTVCLASTVAASLAFATSVDASTQRPGIWTGIAAVGAVTGLGVVCSAMMLRGRARPSRRPVGAVTVGAAFVGVAAGVAAALFAGPELPSVAATGAGGAAWEGLEAAGEVEFEMIVTVRRGDGASDQSMRQTGTVNLAEGRASAADHPAGVEPIRHDHRWEPGSQTARTGAAMPIAIGRLHGVVMGVDEWESHATTAGRVLRGTVDPRRWTALHAADVSNLRERTALRWNASAFESGYVQEAELWLDDGDRPVRLVTTERFDGERLVATSTVTFTSRN